MSYIAVELICTTIKKTKDFEAKKKKITRCVAITVISIIWLSLFSLAVFPRICANVEYKTNATEKTMGVVEDISGDRNCYYLKLDGNWYALLRSRDYNEEIVSIESIDIGDTVTIKHGKHSSFIFEIVEEIV